MAATDALGVSKTILMHLNPACAHIYTCLYAIYKNIYVCLCLCAVNARPAACLQSALYRSLTMATRASTQPLPLSARALKWAPPRSEGGTARNRPPSWHCPFKAAVHVTREEAGQRLDRRKSPAATSARRRSEPRTWRVSKVPGAAVPRVWASLRKRSGRVAASIPRASPQRGWKERWLQGGGHR